MQQDDQVGRPISPPLKRMQSARQVKEQEGALQPASARSLNTSPQRPALRRTATVSSKLTVAGSSSVEQQLSKIRMWGNFFPKMGEYLPNVTLVCIRMYSLCIQKNYEYT